MLQSRQKPMLQGKGVQTGLLSLVHDLSNMAFCLFDWRVFLESFMQTSAFMRLCFYAFMSKPVLSVHLVLIKLSVVSNSSISFLILIKLSVISNSYVAPSLFPVSVSLYWPLAFVLN